MSTELAAHTPMPFGARAALMAPQQASALLDAMMPRTPDQALRMAVTFSKCRLVPKSYQGPDKVEDIIVAGMWGAQLGLNWLQSLKNIAVINGSPGIWGDAGHALMLRSGQLVRCEQSWDPVSKVATCTIERRGYDPRTVTFSWEQAKLAKLANKDTYQCYPDVMCGWRAFWRCARPEFGDIFMGMQGAEELFDTPKQDALPAPIPEPKAIEDRSMGDALKEYAESGKAQPAQGARPGPAAGAPATSATADYSQPTHVTGVEERSYKVPKGKADAGATKYYWIISLTDGRKASTYSESFKATAQQALDESIPVTVDTLEKGGYTNVKDIIFTPPVTPTADPGPAEPSGDESEGPPDA